MFILFLRLNWVGKLKALFLLCFLCPVNLPFVWGKDCKGIAGSHQTRRIWKKKWAPPHWKGQCFVISYFSAVLLLLCQAIWMVVVCFHVTVREVVIIYLHFQLQNWHSQSYPENLWWSQELISLSLLLAAPAELFCLVCLLERSSSYFFWSISKLCQLLYCLEALFNLTMRTFDGYILGFPTTLQGLSLQGKGQDFLLLLERKKFISSNLLTSTKTSWRQQAQLLLTFEMKL